MAVKKRTKPNTTPAQKLAASCELVDVRIVESHFRQSLRIGDLPTNTEMTARIETHIPPSEAESLEHLFRVVGTFQLTASYEADSPDQAIVIVARFQMTFKAAATELITKEALGPFAEGPGLFMIWPYWREFVQNATSRMMIPAFVVPILTPGALQRDDATPAIRRKPTSSPKKS